MNKLSKTKPKLTKGEKFQKSVKHQSSHSSPMSNLSWCSLNNKGNLLKVHDVCPNPKGKSQKRLTFTLNQFQLEGAGCKDTLNKLFKGSQKA